MDALTVEELEAEVRRFVTTGEHALVLNANVHCLNLCYEDPRLRNFLNSTSLVFCDGAGVMLAARILGSRIPQRITYADWIWRLAALAETEEFSLYFLGAKPSVAEKAARRLKTWYPRLRIAGTRHGYFDHAAGSSENEAVLAGINAAEPDILVVGFGMPLQEYWLMENWDRVNAKVALTGGAVFDYAAGELRRGPRFMTVHGFEWLARLLIEPRKLWRRYLIGNPLFLIRVIRQLAFSGKDEARSGGSR